MSTNLILANAKLAASADGGRYDAPSNADIESPRDRVDDVVKFGTAG